MTLVSYFIGYQEDTNAPVGQKISCPASVCFHQYSIIRPGNPAAIFLFEACKIQLLMIEYKEVRINRMNRNNDTARPAERRYFCERMSPFFMGVKIRSWPAGLVFAEQPPPPGQTIPPGVR